AARIERVTDQQARERGLKWDGDLSGLFFPYYLPGVGYVWGRVRRDSPERDADGREENKYIGIPGNHHLYLPPNAETFLKDSKLPILFVESEKASLTLTAWAARSNQQLLVPATGGVWGWRGVIGKTRSANGNRVDQKGPLPDLELFRGHPASILFDANVTADRPDLREARNAFAKTLKEKNCSVRMIDLPGGDGINGPDDFLAVRDDKEMARLVAEPDSADIVIETEAFLQKFAVLPMGMALACTLWAIGTYMYKSFEVFPYLAITGPAKRCGKTRLTEVLEIISANP